jgi:hypothetical protein
VLIKSKYQHPLQLFPHSNTNYTGYYYCGWSEYISYPDKYISKDADFSGQCIGVIFVILDPIYL